MKEVFKFAWKSEACQHLQSRDWELLDGREFDSKVDVILRLAGAGSVYKRWVIEITYRYQNADCTYSGFKIKSYPHAKPYEALSSLKLEWVNYELMPPLQVSLWVRSMIGIGCALLCYPQLSFGRLLHFKSTGLGCVILRLSQQW